MYFTTSYLSFLPICGKLHGFNIVNNNISTFDIRINYLWYRKKPGQMFFLWLWRLYSENLHRENIFCLKGIEENGRVFQQLMTYRWTKKCINKNDPKKGERKLTDERKNILVIMIMLQPLKSKLLLFICVNLIVQHLWYNLE